MNRLMQYMARLWPAPPVAPQSPPVTEFLLPMHEKLNGSSIRIWTFSP